MAGFILARVYGQNTCINFPAGFIPFSSIDYVTAADSAGDHLVAGAPASGAMSAINAIPLPAFTNQMFCDAEVQLGPQQFYPNVYVPTSDERAGNFSAFAGLLLNPATNLPYPQGVIPASQLNNVFAWRIGAAQTPSANGGWSPTGSMMFALDAEPAVPLPSGKVLVVGPVISPQLYDPATGTFTSAGHTVFAHGGTPTATLLNNGQVLIVGGSNLPSAAELYDPSSGQFVATGAPVQPHGYQHSATLLNDGRVLVVGGLMQPGTPATGTNAGAETYDPQTGAFTAAGPMLANRNGHTATLLADGRVLVAAGLASGNGSTDTQLNSAEVFSPATGTFAATLPMTEPRLGHVAVLLPDGNVLVAGGVFLSGTAELFNPTTLAFIPTGSMNNPLRQGSRAALLSSGQVLVAGGGNGGGFGAIGPMSTAAAELYTPATGIFTPTGSMGTPRNTFEAALLLDGRFLAAGGQDLDSGTNVASAELYTPTIEGLITSQTGLTFRIAQGSATPPPQTVAVLSNTATIPWALSVHTYQGGNWLSVTPTSGNSVPGATPVILTFSVNQAGLAAQDYYATATLTPTDGIHPPISISIVLSIVPGGTTAPPAVSPSGLLFLATPGATLPPQTFAISNLTSTPITFSGSGSASWFNIIPQSGTIAGAQSTSITVTPSIGGFTTGVYPASIVLTFGDGSTQTVAVLLVISAIPGTSNARPASRATASTCTPTTLLPVFTTLGSGFNTLAAWPTSIVVQVVDDCGNEFNTGSVIVSFSDGDPPISLLATGAGNWAGTWVPEHSATGFSARADAQQLPLSGSVAVTGQVSSNPNVPIVETGGIVSSGDYASSPALGLLVSIFGTGMADQPAKAKTLPLPTQLGTTSVALSSGALLPLLYVSNQQINVLIPYEVAVNTTQQLVVLRDNAVSVPVSTAVFNSSPAILATAGNGVGQGHIYVVNSGILTLADQNAPASAGDVLTIYCVGLGTVTPPVTSGAAAPDSPLSYAAAPVTVTIGGQVAAPPTFAGVTPGFAGLYQIDVAVPAGVTPGNQVPVTISVAGKSGPGNIFMAIH